MADLTYWQAFVQVRGGYDLLVPLLKREELQLYASILYDLGELLKSHTHCLLPVLHLLHLQIRHVGIAACVLDSVFSYDVVLRELLLTLSVAFLAISAALVKGDGLLLLSVG